MGVNLNAFLGARSALLNVNAENTVINVPAGYDTLVVSMQGVTDSIVFAEGPTVAYPSAGVFSAGSVVQGGSVQSFSISKAGVQLSFTPSAAGGVIALTVGYGA